MANDKPSAEGLLPCPFCGGEAQLVEGHLDHWRAECSGCRALTDKWFARDGAKAKAIAAWNRRAALEAAALSQPRPGAPRDDLARRFRKQVEVARAYAIQELQGAPTSTFEIMVGHFAAFADEIDALSAAQARAEADRAEIFGLTAERDVRREAASAILRGQITAEDRAEAAEAQIATLTAERDEARENSALEWASMKRRLEASEARIAELTAERDEARSRIADENRWPDPLLSLQAEAIRAGKIDDTSIRDLFDRMEREIKLLRAGDLQERREELGDFITALQEWGCDHAHEQAVEIGKFLASPHSIEEYADAARTTLNAGETGR